MSADRHRWHDAVLVSLALSFPRPPAYVEVGVASCVCFNQVAPHCRVAHAVDVSPHAVANVTIGCQWPMGSDQFFAEYDGHPDLIFIDGDHHYEQASRDFDNAARILAPGGTIAVHDVWPGSAADTRPEACGDVYRLVDDIQHAGLGVTEQGWVGDPEWDTYLYRTFPGLLICQRRAPMPEWA